ncbi:MAG: hypothetical protein Q8M98_05330 [Candidatus Cloacimonadaceae bacterium]|nr:hypothetical protein [Candidatus Cloacimonadaceae bacterium]MDP3114183.1 hypothetical protein [Candidatus Cloacimonadaceae bacterium]
MMKYNVLLILLILFGAGVLNAQDLALPEPQIASNGSLGFGFGLPYGGLGFNADLNLLEHLALTAGIGTFGYVSGYELGLKGFLFPLKSNWRPQITLLYGINGMVLIDIPAGADIKEAYRGFTVGAGSRWMFGDRRNHGMDFDILYVINSGMFERIDELEEQGYVFTKVNRFTLSFGYRYAF